MPGHLIRCHPFVGRSYLSVGRDDDEGEEDLINTAEEGDEKFGADQGSDRDAGRDFNLKRRHLTRFWTGGARSSFSLVQTVDLRLFCKEKCFDRTSGCTVQASQRHCCSRAWKFKAREGYRIYLRCTGLRQRSDQIMDCCSPFRVTRSKVTLLRSRTLEPQYKKGTGSLITVHNSY